MACGAENVSTLSAVQRVALDKLRAGLASGRVRARRTARGVVLEGWPESERGGLCDGCVVRTLANSPELRRALAQGQQGRAVINGGRS